MWEGNGTVLLLKQQLVCMFVGRTGVGLRQLKGCRSGQVICRNLHAVFAWGCVYDSPGCVNRAGAHKRFTGAGKTTGLWIH